MILQSVKNDKPSIKQCHSCDKKATTDQKMLRCSVCKQVNYCNAACQRKDWKEHQVVCKPPEPKIEKKCQKCGKTNKQLKESAEKVKKCSKCLKIYYCSKNCQEKDWPKHKEVCQRPTQQLNKEDKTKLEIDKAFSTCWTCKKTDVKVFECATCHFARYCSPECRNNNADLHNSICKRAAKNYVVMDEVEDRQKAMHIVTVRRFQEKLTSEKIEQIQENELMEELFHVTPNKVVFYS